MPNANLVNTLNPDALSAEKYLSQTNFKFIDLKHPSVSCRSLGAGEHNRVWRIQSKTCDVVVRLPKGKPHQPGFYAAEFYNQYCAYQLGLAPKIWAEDARTGLLASDYVSGRLVKRSDFNSKAFCTSMANALRRLHDSGQWFLYKHDFLLVTGRRIRRQLNVNVVQLPGTLYKMTKVAAKCRKILLSQEIVLSPIHGDLALVNMILSPKGLQFIDWEAAGMGDRLDELACVIFNAGLTPDEAVKFMKLYLKGYEIPARDNAIARTFLYWLLHVYRWAVDHEQRAKHAACANTELRCRNARIYEFRALLESEVVQRALYYSGFYDVE